MLDGEDQQEQRVDGQRAPAARKSIALDVPLNKARPWRDTARAGDIYDARRVRDPRSTDRTGT